MVAARAADLDEAGTLLFREGAATLGAVRLLKLATSDEVSGDVPPESRAGAVSARFL